MCRLTVEIEKLIDSMNACLLPLLRGKVGMGVAFDFKVKSNPLRSLPPQKGKTSRQKH
jgi:hypothetical protein